MYSDPHIVDSLMRLTHAVLGLCVLAFAIMYFTPMHTRLTNRSITLFWNVMFLTCGFGLGMSLVLDILFNK